MPAARNIDLTMAIFLAGVCNETYSHLANDGSCILPVGYEALHSFKATALNGREWFGFLVRSKSNAVVAFRGTATERDCVVDAEAFQTAFTFAPGKLRTHDGFTSTYASCRDEIMCALRALPQSTTLYVTGHSMGGALATLHALDVAVNLRFRRLAVYTFASPRVGNPLFATAFNREISASVRVVNVHDLVPRLPPAFLPLPEPRAMLRYQHVRREFALAAQTGTVRGNHSLHTYMEALRGLKDEAANRLPVIPPRRRTLISRRTPG